MRVALFHNRFGTWVMVAVVAVGAAHWLWFLALPQWLWKARNQGPTSRERMRHYLEFVLATPSLLGGLMKAPVRLMLLELHVRQARHEEVAATCRHLLASGLTPGLESTTRHHLADSLEALNDPEAADERRRARDCLKGVGDDFVTLQARGKLMNKESRYEEAYALFENGLGMVPRGMPPEVRVQLLLQMALAAFNAGRIEDAARDGERAIAAGAEGDSLRTAHRHVGTCLSSLGRLDEAEVHKRKSYEVAVAQREPAAIADALADLAGIRRNLGKLAEAHAACEEAEAAHPGKCRQASTVRYNILKDWGRFDEALAVLGRTRKMSPLVIPHAERRTQAIFDMGAAWIALDRGRPDEAEACLRAAEPALGNDPKLSLWPLSASARVAAQRGDRDAYRDAFEEAGRRVKEFSEDRSTQRTVWISLGKAAVEIADFGRGVPCCEQYLALGPHPVDRPVGHYYLGLCHEGLGDLKAARAAFREAIAPAIDAHYARLAQTRLRNLPIG